jgi:tryptophan 7-halogenase
MFKVSGRVLREDGELFTEEAWTQVMIGQGIVPDKWHPLADIADEDELSGYLESIASAYAARAAQLPTHAQFVDRVVGVESRAKEHAA